ncbi:MBL fold metallo-hydrolase [Archaeoglobus veneficus]|uniref:Beta-lactamase domain protein n=1 Tax=Archaeoglobus veneficus (strain DSM 11195 / SNP6) TaxID=693661 RepID=F2KSE5_ARCVS|nr:MBL fold metallo-hydrolase [Archaeoglobus veneficus]AEA46914.1 beta-lactamase domain protein [Archaeoglobus veneficus SNP6]
MQLHFYGAARSVTGSCFMLEDGQRILIDVGMFQGSVEKRNYRRFPFDPSEIDALILTHSHLDHIGLLPKLVKYGFNGEIYATRATREIAEHMLYDSAKVQEEEAHTLTRKNLRKGLPVVKPLYTTEDVKECFRLKWRNVEYGKTVSLDNMAFTFRNAGHVLGSAFVEIDAGKKFVFSGDLGERGRLIIRDPEFPPKANYLVVESTYGDRNHRSVEESIEELKQAIMETFERGGNVLIPSFALERTQEILYVLHVFYRNGELPDCEVFLDSPLAIDITEVFLNHPELYNEETSREAKHGNPFFLPHLRFTKSVEESREINEVRSHAIIIAGSGMCTGGRIKHHLKHNLWRRECSVVFVGYQVKGTLGRKIVDGAKRVRIYGEEIAVKAKIYTINGFSAHAGRDYLVEWSSKSQPEKVFVVHGEFEKSQKLARGLKDFECVIPAWRQSFAV